ncbi:flagellar biosynthesis anti-sigma factor FlgM [Kinneretia asaccharophila]|nr:flagellar biosynthesis anti-sigma factor FlgM [Roseateles asaccharophilus]MDN3546557.1 flagellar biosynthesis anti-sigma factor FlgM [Roseateles asaccharophilus]
MEISMKIGNSPEKLASTPVGTNGAAEAPRGGARQAPAVAGKAPDASAQIKLSSTASAMLSGVAEEGSFDAEKVGRISQAITEGRFSINADAIADKLIANAQEMLARATPH